MKLIYLVFLAILLNLVSILGINNLNLSLAETVYPPLGELNGICLLNLQTPLDLGFEPKITLSVGSKKEARNALDVLSSLDPDLDIQESKITLINPATQKTFDLNAENYFGLKLPKGSDISIFEFDIEGVNNNGFPNFPFIDFKNDNLYEWHYAGNFKGWENNFVNARGLNQGSNNEDIIVRDNSFLYCSLIDLPYSNKFNISIDYLVENTAGNISLQLFNFREDINTAFDKKGECLLKNILGTTTSNCVINTNSFLGGNHLVCFYNFKNSGSYLLSLDDQGTGSFECESILLDDDEVQCSYLQEGDFFIKAYKPVFEGELNRKVKFSDFGKDDFIEELNSYLADCEQDQNGECDIILKIGSQNDKGKLTLSNFNIEYQKVNSASFIIKRGYDVEYSNAKILGLKGQNFNNYSLEIPLAIFDNFTIPNISGNISTKKVKINLGILNDEEDIEINNNAAVSTQNSIDNYVEIFQDLKSNTELNDFYLTMGINFDAPISRLNDYKSTLDTLNNNPALSITEKNTEIRKINDEAVNYVQTFPKKININENANYPRIYPETIKPEILKNNNEEDILRRQDEVEIDTSIKLITIENFDGTIIQKSLITRNLKGDFSYSIFEDISKDVVNNADMIKFSSGADIVNQDPILKWDLNGDGEINYVLDGNILNKINKITTIIIPSELKFKENEQSICGDNICTDILEDKISCPQDCKAKYDVNWLLLIILIIILILGVIYFNLFMGKKSLKEIISKKSLFASPNDEINLKNYILKSLNKNVPRGVIYKILLQKKWNKEQVDFVFKKLQPKNKINFNFLKKK